MDDRLQELERAAEADPDDLSLQLELLRACQRYPPPDGAARLMAFLEVLKSPRLDRATVAGWVQERCDRRQRAALFASIFEDGAPYLRDRALWILGAGDPAWALPVLLDLAERHPGKGRGAIHRMLDLAAQREDIAARCRAIVADEGLVSARVRGWIAEGLELR